MELSNRFLTNRRLETLVENQTTFSLESAELHVFETHQAADKILLKFNQPVLASMLKGKKVMHLENMAAFDFLPGESLILPANELMCIDFPEARMESPTHCLAMAISEDKILDIVNLLNENHAKADGEWRFTDYNFHFTNDIAIQQIIQRLLFVFAEDHPSKDLFADFMLRELIIRILQTEAKKIYQDKTMYLDGEHRLSYIIQYIRDNLDKHMTIKELSSKIYMSEPNFHRVFKNELGTTPIEFINSERIKLAKSLLQDPHKKIKEVSVECGFNSLTYFIRQFKRKEQVSPKDYQLRIAIQQK
ncbi:MAG: AraC family transcriptional regulator [Saprospiraceae bacterium]|nr:AraC family transcriptional regulator [Saprospiraceae bacterium]